MPTCVQKKKDLEGKNKKVLVKEKPKNKIVVAQFLAK